MFGLGRVPDVIMNNICHSKDDHSKDEEHNIRLMEKRCPHSSKVFLCLRNFSERGNNLDTNRLTYL